MDEGNEEGVSTERRAEDQDTAVEQAFVAGTLPEADRRAEEPAAEPTVATETPVVSTGIVDRRVVRAIGRGFHGRIREIGEVFEIGGEEEVGAWMELVDTVYVA